ncbi:MAG: HDIG domain-containing protein [Selenomonadaceae bacterium]|nr:HDIG domain-containing protein [Selenomonadaceae bacterium]
MNWIFKRARQFYRAMKADISIEDEKYLMAHLNAEEQKLFMQMGLIDQFHSLNVAYTIERLIIQGKQGVDREFLIRCALLHDIGKINFRATVWDKVFAVLVTTFFPWLADRLELRGNRSIYIYRNHAELGGQKLQKMGLFQEAKIIARHHSPPRDDDPRELKLLRLADEEN